MFESLGSTPGRHEVMPQRLVVSNLSHLSRAESREAESREANPDDVENRRDSAHSFPMKVELLAETDIGQVRRINEDSYRLIPAQQVAIVCDGMGGHAAGEVASRCAVETVEAYLTRDASMPVVAQPDWDEPQLAHEARELVWAIRLANRRVFLAAQSQQQMAGMGTTLVALRVASGTVTVCHVGDSRAYRWHAGELEPVTVDHSLVAELVARNEITAEQAESFADRNIITRALGTRPAVAVDVNVIPAKTGDWYLLCSDGLSGVLTDGDIADTIRRNSNDPAQVIRELIERANDRGGPDNITAAIAVVRDADHPQSLQSESGTVPESPAEIGDKEDAYLDMMFGSGDADSIDLTEERTDRIPLNLSRQQRPPE